jgi:hypothetical protein
MIRLDRRIAFACYLALSATAARAANPCNLPPGWAGTNPESTPTQGLSSIAGGLIVYDENQGLCWLGNANLAGNATAREVLGVTGINPDGTMDYATALNWVTALNSFDGGKGVLGQHNWQLPQNPLDDPTCSSFNNGNFGVSCTGSALGNLYSIGLGVPYPNSAMPGFTDSVPPFVNLQPGLYWTAEAKGNGEQTFSFNTGLSGENTTKFNYFYVLAVTATPIGPPPPGTGVIAYTTGPAAGEAVYDTNTGLSWILNAGLAASDKFGVTGTTTITSNSNGTTYTVPLINSSGAMLFSATSEWIAGMNSASYAGTTTWTLAELAQLQTLYTDLGLQAGTVQLESFASVGPFRNFQPGFYWACETDPTVTGNSQSPCDPAAYPQPNYMYSFNFDDGFENTDLLTKEFYVMVYYPAKE